MLTNHRPVVSGTDEAIWSRLRLVPWDVVIPVEERDLMLADKLAVEREAVLAWLARGYREWHGGGLADPEQVTTATAAYRAESDALARFIDQRCLTGPHFHVWSAELFAAWVKWCTAENEDPGTQTAFSLALTNRGFDRSKVHGRMRWRGLGLAAEGEG
jgi:putative DNA primase/helicase